MRSIIVKINKRKVNCKSLLKLLYIRGERGEEERKRQKLCVWMRAKREERHMQTVLVILSFFFSLLQGPFPCLKGRYKSSSVFFVFGASWLQMHRHEEEIRLDQIVQKQWRGREEDSMCSMYEVYVGWARERDVVCGVSFFFHPQLKRTHKYALHASLWLSILLIKIARTHRHCCRTHSSKHSSTQAYTTP